MSISRSSRRNKPASASGRNRAPGEDDFRAVRVRVDAESITVLLDDGREVSASVPKYFPFLEDLSEKALRRTRLIDDGMAIYFPSIEEYASVFSVVHPEKTVLAASLRRPVKRQSPNRRAAGRSRS